MYSLNLASISQGDDMSLSRKLVFIISFITIFIVISSISVAEYFTFKQMESNVIKEAEVNLQAKKVLVSDSITDYFDSIQNQITVKAFDVTTVEAAQAFKKGFNKYPVTDSTSLANFYEQDFKTSFNNNNQNSINISGLYKPLSSITTALQTQFLSDNKNPLGEKDNLTALNDNTDYDKAHQRYHPSFQKFLKEFGYYDVFIVEPDNGDIVYSVYKEIDYATSLTTGPYNNTGISEAFNAVLRLRPGETYLTDFKAYLPSYNNAASFMSTPIFD